MCFDKSHEETKADEHHNINILICGIIILIVIDIGMCKGSDEKSINKENNNLQEDDEDCKIPPISPMGLNPFLIFHDFANKIYLNVESTINIFLYLNHDFSQNLWIYCVKSVIGNSYVFCDRWRYYGCFIRVAGNIVIEMIKIIWVSIAIQFIHNRYLLIFIINLID